MGASTPSSARARRGVGRPASPATPEGGEEGSAAASSRARQKRAERKSSSSESSSEPFASPRKARKEGAFSRQGDIRAMFAAGKEGARATRARAARAA
jgi:hypothetical protein